MTNTLALSSFDGSIPAHNKHAAYDATAKGHARRKRLDTSRYLARPFVAWDGEGVTVEGRHLYVTLANSLGERLRNPNGLPTRDVFEFLLDTKAEKDSIHCIYGGGYDANCWLADLPLDALNGIYDNESWRVGEYRVAYRRGKWIRISRGNRAVLVYDVMPFFQVPFVSACRSYLGEDYPDRDLIEKNKRLRSGFTMSDLAEIERYNDAELANLVALMNEFRGRLDRAGLRPSRWDGPGAIAATLMKMKGVRNAITREVPEAVTEAGRFAYAGGRFEVIKCGYVSRPTYQYDVNSAYPSAFRHVPNLSRGRWVTEDFTLSNSSRFGVAHVRFRADSSHTAIPGPLYRRHKNGAISYPLYTEGWYWYPEVATACEWVERFGGDIAIDRAYVFDPNDEAEKPFGFIDPLYARRQEMKARGDGAHVGLKLALNSLYGKTCQQIGAKVVNGEWKLPPFHQLEYAGYVTASCRAQLLRAAMLDIENVIAFETDALFISEPIDLPLGSGLGEWERTEYESLLYAQSGFYFGRIPNGYPGLDYGAPVDKTRGMDRGSVTRDEVIAAMGYPRANRAVSASLTRFIGYGYARRADLDKWRQWVRFPKTIACEPTTGKRWHLVCDKCVNDNELTLGVWHDTFCPFLGEEANYQYPIVWANPDPAMTMLEELRTTQNEERALEYD